MCREEGTMGDRKEFSPEAGESRRDAVKKMAYAAPFVLSLAASPAFASSGSGCNGWGGLCHDGSQGDRSNAKKRYKTNTR